MRLLRALSLVGVGLLSTVCCQSTSPTSSSSSVSKLDKNADLEMDRVKGYDITTVLNGAPVADDDNSLRAGRRGPHLLEDVNFRTKMHHFDHEPIPERVVHARGSGAHGEFELLRAIPEFTKAAVLNNVGVKTPVFVRFSTVLGNRGSADTVRDVRGFATKFYTSEGNWDLVGNNIPVFFIQDAMKFPDLVHAGKPENDNAIPQAQTAHDNFYDFASLTTETAHMIMWTSSDRAIPRSYRMMQGFGVNTYSLVNVEGARVFVKFHWRPALGVHSLVWDEAVKIAGADPDFHRRDLWENIASGNYPSWELGLQIVNDTDAYDFDVLDATKIIPEEIVPVMWGIGRMTLNRNPDEFQAETEQVSYCVQNIVPGIGFSDDPLLQGRAFSYFDTNIRRHSSPNFDQLPINRPLCPVMNNMRGGAMNTKIHPGKINYFPNRFGTPHPPVAGPANKAIQDYMEKLQGMVTRLRGPKFADHFSQATLFFNSLTNIEQQHVIDALSFELSKVESEAVRNKFVNTVLNEIDNKLAVSVAVNCGANVPAKLSKVYPTATSSKLSQFAYSSNTTIATRKIAILVSDGYNAQQLTAVSDVIKALGAVPLTVANKLSPLTFVNDANDKNAPQAGGIKANFTLFNSKSVLFDAVLIMDTATPASSLANNGAVFSFINEAFKHYKAIAAVGPGVALLDAANLPGVSVASSSAASTVVDSMGVVSAVSVSDYGDASAAPDKMDPSFVETAISKVFGNNDAGFMSKFVGHVAHHRYWDRDVSKVPA